MAGMYHPNPYHPPMDSVRVKTRLGMSTRRIIRAEVPPRYAHLMQYRYRPFSYVEGFKP